MVASGGGLGAGLVRCDDVGSVLVWVTVSESRFAAGGGLGGGLWEIAGSCTWLLGLISPSRDSPRFPMLVSDSWWVLPACADLVMAWVV